MAWEWGQWVGCYGHCNSSSKLNIPHHALHFRAVTNETLLTGATYLLCVHLGWSWPYNRWCRPSSVEASTASMSASSTRAWSLTRGDWGKQRMQATSPCHWNIWQPHLSLSLERQAYTDIAYVPIVQDGFQLMSGFIHPALFPDPTQLSITCNTVKLVQYCERWKANGAIYVLYMYYICTIYVLYMYYICTGVTRWWRLLSHKSKLVGWLAL